ncbi:MAG: winged helix-turn-helix transcriptional regulator [Ruminococcaceae bacterium]|nr:winged helix-turn-helix transcriptional regulator [Oscillospiraceae bacterium]
MEYSIDYKEIFELTRRYGRLKSKSLGESGAQEKCLKGAELAVMFAIQHISLAKKATTSLVASELMMPKSQVSRVLNALESEELIERINSKTDRRAVYIILTEKGKALLLESENNYKRFINYIYESIGQSDFEQLIRILKKVEDALEDCRD